MGACFTLLWALIYCDSCQAQPGLALETYGHFGHLSIRKSDHALPTVRMIRGGELTISRQTDGQSMWQRVHGLPQMGLTFQARNLGNSSVYGYDLALVPFLEFNVWSTKHTILQIKHGTGIGYVSKRYDGFDNLNNHLISTAINAVSLLSMGLLVRGSDYVDVKVGIEVSHKSNSNIRQPNEGLNTGVLYAGLRYYPGKKRSSIRLRAVDLHRHQWQGYVGTALGLYGASETGRLLVTPQLEAVAMLQHDIRFRAMAGVEFIGQNGSQIGAKIGEEVLFGHIGIRYQVGVYLHNTTNSGPVYEKIGIAYYPFPLVDQLAKRVSVGTSLKAHGLRAAFVEVNAGYTF